MSEICAEERGCQTMISYEQIAVEIERQLHSVHSTGDERKMREAFSAIRALCEVALSTSEGKLIQPKMLVTRNVQSSPQVEGELLAEDDANGGSIFDF